MKHVTNILAVSIVLVLTLYGSLHPDRGVMMHYPSACIGIGLIGLGMVMNARQRAAVKVSSKVNDRSDGYDH